MEGTAILIWFRNTKPIEPRKRMAKKKIRMEDRMTTDKLE